MDAGAILSGIEICWKVGRVLIEYCQAWKAAEEEVSDRVVIVESAWHRTATQLEFVQRIELDDEHRRILDNLIRTLALRLSSAITLINQTLKAESEKRRGFLEFAQRVRKPKYALLKSAIDDAINEVEAWHARFDPSWFLIMRTAGAAIDDELGRAMQKESRATASRGRSAGSRLRRHTRQTHTPFEAAQGLREALHPTLSRHTSIFLPQIEFERRDIPYSSVQIARPTNQSNARWFIIDSVVCRPGSDPNAVARDVRVLARKLTKADPVAFGLLQCKGVIQVPGDPATGAHPSLDLVLRAPEGFDTGKSLRQFLLEQKDQNSFVSLNRYFAIARELTRSVSSVHTFKFVHKNVRPESVLLLEDSEGNAHPALLVGFDNFRAADGATNLRGDTEWDRNMYRHPTRQGEFPEEKYRMHHDIYSLGVCLLELGLHESFISYDDQDVSQPGSLFAHFDAWLESTGRGGHWGASVSLKDYFEHLAQTQLPRFVGDGYSNIVLACLTCLDEDSDDFAEEVDVADRDGISLGMKFIQKILLRINELSL